MKDAGVQFYEGIPVTDHLKSWFPKGVLLVLDGLLADGGEGKELLDLFTKHSHHQNITVLYLCQDMFPPGKYAKSIFQERPLHRTLQESTRSSRHEEFYCFKPSSLAGKTCIKL